MSKKKNRKPERDFLEQDRPRCALDYASISKEIFDTLIENNASPTAVKLAVYYHFNLGVNTGDTHARTATDAARDLRVSVGSVYRAVAELTELEIIDELQEGSAMRFNVRAYVPMRKEAARRQRERAEDQLQNRMQDAIARFAKKHGRQPTARWRSEQELKFRRELGLG